MGIITRATYGDPIPMRDGEAIQIRLVDVETKTGITQRIDVRMFIESERYTGPSKNGFQTDDPDTLRDLAAALIAAADDAEARGMKPGNGAAPTAVQVVPVPKAPAKATGVAAKRAMARNTKVPTTPSEVANAKSTVRKPAVRRRVK